MSTIKLYSVKTTVENWRGSGKPVDYHWFYHNRQQPVAPYADVIENYDPDDLYAQGLIDELFTLEEAEQLVGWLTRCDYEGEHTMKEFRLPVAHNAMGVSAMAVGGTDDFYMLSKSEDYDLPFDVWGYYRYEHIKENFVIVSSSEDGEVNVQRASQDTETGEVTYEDIPTLDELDGMPGRIELGPDRGNSLHEWRGVWRYVLIRDGIIGAFSRDAWGAIVSLAEYGGWRFDQAFPQSGDVAYCPADQAAALAVALKGVLDDIPDADTRGLAKSGDVVTVETGYTSIFEVFASDEGKRILRDLIAFCSGGGFSITWTNNPAEIKGQD